MNITILSTKQWYNLLLNDEVLMLPANEHSPAILRPARCELENPNSDWNLTWRLLNIKGLTSCEGSFLFKLIHLLLPTQERTQRLGADRENARGLCRLCSVEREDLLHAFFICPFNKDAGRTVIKWANVLSPNINEMDLLCLQINEGGMDGFKEMAIVIIVGTCLKFIWEERKHRNKVGIYQIRAELEAKISILRKTRFSDVANAIFICINS